MTAGAPPATIKGRETARGQGGQRRYSPQTSAELREGGKGGNGATSQLRRNLAVPPTPTLSPKPLAPGPEKGGGATRCIPGTERQRPPSEPAGWPAREVGGGNPTMPTDSAEECKSPLPGEDNHPLSKARGSHLCRIQATRQTGTAAGNTAATCKTEKKTGPTGHPHHTGRDTGHTSKRIVILHVKNEIDEHPQHWRSQAISNTGEGRTSATQEKAGHLPHRRSQETRNTGEGRIPPTLDKAGYQQHWIRQETCNTG